MKSPLNTPPKRFVRWDKNSRVDIDALLRMEPTVSPEIVRDLVKILAKLYAAEGRPPAGHRAFQTLEWACGKQVSAILRAIFGEEMEAENAEWEAEEEADRLARRAERRAKGLVPVSRSLRKQIFERDGFRCLHCGSEEDLTIDHVIPASKDGPSTPENLQTLCRSCNCKKGNRISA